MTATAPRPRILYVSSLPAANSTSGALLLHRHFSLAETRFEIFHAHDSLKLAEDVRHFRVPLRPAYRRVQSTRWFKFIWSLNHGLGCSVAPSDLDALVRRLKPEAILTVAEGPLMAPVRRLARRSRLPLVTVFHDWASNWLPAPPWVKRLVDRQIRRLARSSRVNLCVSHAFRAELGPAVESWFLPPIPAAEPTPSTHAPDVRASVPSFTAVYAGVMHHLYRDEIDGLARALHAQGDTTLLRAYGPQAPAQGILADGPPEARAIYGGFLKGESFERTLSTADALVVISPFGAEWRKIAQFSFPSKIPEYCRFGKPLVLWGPADSTAAEWARVSGAALTVTDPSPVAAANALRRLREAPELRAQLANSAKRAAATTFHPGRLQQVFERSLLYAMGRAERPLDSEIQ